MESVSTTLAGILKDLGLEREATLGTVRTQWHTLVGEPIASHTTPFSHHQGQLVIHVDSPEWLHELRYFQQTIQEKLKPFGFNSVRMKLGTVRKRAPQKPPRKEMKPISPEDREFIDEITSGIDDPLMKERIRKALESSLSSSR